MDTFVFTPRDSDSVDMWASQIGTMYSDKKPVKMLIDLEHIDNFDVKKILGLKCVLDAYRPLTKQYLTETQIKIKNPLMKNLVRTCLVFFKPEKPVRFI